MYEANNASSHRLHQFLADMTRLVDTAPPEAETLAQGRRLLQNLLQNSQKNDLSSLR
jgi:predicted metal-dependent enzyme (double-stranded beta helix superfamily)